MVALASFHPDIPPQKNEGINITRYKCAALTGGRLCAGANRAAVLRLKNIFVKRDQPCFFYFTLSSRHG